MKKLLFFLVCSSMLLLTKCKKDDETVPECVTFDTVESLKDFIEAADADNNLVAEYSYVSGSHILSFEDQATICFSDELITRLEVFESEWKITLEYADGTETEAGYLGDDLELRDESITLNPFGSCPLSAWLSWSTPVPGKVKVRVIGQDGPESDIFTSTGQLTTEHEVQVLGLYGEYNNEVEINFTNNEGEPRFVKVLKVQTGDLPDEYPEFEVAIPYAQAPANQVFLLNYRSPHRPLMVDAFGKVRWFGDWLPNSKKRGLQRLKNGNLAFGGDTNGIIYEYTMAGEKVNEWQVQPPYKRVHHDFVELPNGNFVVTVEKIGASTSLDHLIEMDRESGTTLKVWDFNENLPKRDTFFDYTTDWLHVNSVDYDPSDHSLVVSGRHQGIFKVDWENNLQWMLAPPEGWGDHEDYLLEAQNGPEPLEWTWGQHSAMVMPNGNIFVFDNGFGREYGQATENYSRAVEYQVTTDGQGGAVQQVWSFGKTWGEGLFSPIISDVDYLPDTDTRLIVSGALGYGHTYNGPMDISLYVTNDNPKVRIIEVDQNKNILFEMTLSSSSQGSSVYRGEKLSIYPD